eukprot:gene18061-19870_t
MGRENELREAAKDGNIAKLEALLSVKKSAFMSSLRKGININCQDESGNTALHIAALNGKMEAVVYLLQNDASANIPDVSGNYPLHLAAFNGHHEVANTLINQGPSRANVIEQNLVGDTALHIAAQFGHTQVVQILLETIAIYPAGDCDHCVASDRAPSLAGLSTHISKAHNTITLKSIHHLSPCHADGNMRNKNQESPLDLAAKFGRLSTVRVLVLWDQSLVRSSCLKHSPLHLSARHGHTSVMTTLLDFGMSVNVMSDLGTALHEAALFGKVDAVRLLLNRAGIKLVGILFGKLKLVCDSYALVDKSRNLFTTEIEEVGVQFKKVAFLLTEKASGFIRRDLTKKAKENENISDLQLRSIPIRNNIPTAER